MARSLSRLLNDVMATIAISFLGLLASAWGQTVHGATIDLLSVGSKLQKKWTVAPSSPAHTNPVTFCCLNIDPGLRVAALDKPDANNQPFSSSNSVPADAYIQPVSVTNIDKTEVPQEQVEWRSLMNNSLRFLGTMHSFRFATEGATRDGLGNSFVSGYLNALGAMHGWSDGDGYYENYLGHPIEGAVSGYMWINNDPRYRYVEFGRNRDYWMSRLRATAFSWAFSEQFEIGPLSEASLGQIQRSCCAYGFVDHVITPVGGLVWIVTGDALDKYVVRKVEDRTRNRLARVLARGVLNPPLSFANLMAFKVPWNRENRPGIHDYDGELYSQPENVNMGTFERSSIPQFELSATVPFLMWIGNLSCIGGGGAGGFRVTPEWQWTLEVGGCSIANSLPKDWSGDSLTFSTGPQWIGYSKSRWTPRIHFRVGGQKITEQYSNPVLKEQILNSLPPTKGPASVYYDYVTPYETTGLSLSVGGGVDFRLHPAVAVQVGSVDYVHSWLGKLNGTDFTHAFRISTGLVLRIGTW